MSLNRRLVFWALHLAGFWPVLSWLGPKLAQDGALIVGIPGLLLMGLLWRGRTELPPVADLAWAAGLTLLYAATLPWAPPSVQALLAYSALSASFSSIFLGRRFHAGLWMVLCLSLPLLPTLRFFLGYPLRVVCGEAAARLLHLSGLDVQRVGTLLVVDGQAVAIDVPCSGMNIAWAALLLAGAWSLGMGLGTRRTLEILALALVTALAANVMRLSSLFFVESAWFGPQPAWFHPGIGLLSFLAVPLVLAWRLHRTAP